MAKPWTSVKLASAGRAPPDLPDPLLADAVMHARADLEPHPLQQHAPQAWPAQREAMHPQQGPFLAQEQTSVHSDSSEWIHNGVADRASNLEVSCKGVTTAVPGHEARHMHCATGYIVLLEMGMTCLH